MVSALKEASPGVVVSARGLRSVSPGFDSEGLQVSKPPHFKRGCSGVKLSQASAPSPAHLASQLRSKTQRPKEAQHIVSVIN